MTIATTRDEVRLLIGDIDSSAQLFQDDEIAWFLAEESDDVYLAAALACDSLARRYARAYDFSTDGQSFSRGQMSEQYRILAKELRNRAAGGISTVVATRADGYSDDITATDVTGSSTVAPRRRYYGQRDLPR